MLPLTTHATESILLLLKTTMILTNVHFMSKVQQMLKNNELTRSVATMDLAWFAVCIK